MESLHLIAETFEVSGEIISRECGRGGGGYLRKEFIKPSFLELGRGIYLENVGLSSGFKCLFQMCDHLLKFIHSSPFCNILQPQSAP